jgi:hypothetical protein
MRPFYSIFLLTFHLSVFAQRTSDPFLKNILEKNPDPYFKRYSRIRKLTGCRSFIPRSTATSIISQLSKITITTTIPAFYFNPASTVKMPLAFLSLEKLNKMHVKGVNKYTSMQFDSSYEKTG